MTRVEINTDIVEVRSAPVTSQVLLTLCLIAWSIWQSYYGDPSSLDILFWVSLYTLYLSLCRYKRVTICRVSGQVTVRQCNFWRGNKRVISCEHSDLSFTTRGNSGELFLNHRDGEELLASPSSLFFRLGHRAKLLRVSEALNYWLGVDRQRAFRI